MNIEINQLNAREILSLDWVLVYLNRNFSQFQVKSITPFSYTIGTSLNGENIPTELVLPNSLFFGKIQLDINPRDGAVLDNELINLKINSFLNRTPFERSLSRIVEIQNYINEATERVELFDRMTLEFQSVAYDTYVTFIGFKIDYN